MLFLAYNLNVVCYTSACDTAAHGFKLLLVLRAMWTVVRDLSGNLV